MILSSAHYTALPTNTRCL